MFIKLSNHQIHHQIKYFFHWLIVLVDLLLWIGPIGTPIVPMGEFPRVKTIQNFTHSWKYNITTNP
jgi:hypothetical protein